MNASEILVDKDEVTTTPRMHFDKKPPLTELQILLQVLLKRKRDRAKCVWEKTPQSASSNNSVLHR